MPTEPPATASENRQDGNEVSTVPNGSPIGSRDAPIEARRQDRDQRQQERGLKNFTVG